MIAGRRRDEGLSLSSSPEAWMPGSADQDTSGPDRDPALAVTTYACPDCGLLLSFVDPKELPGA